MADKVGGILATIKDLITRTKGLDDIHDDLVTVQTDLDNPSQYKSDATLAKQNAIIVDTEDIQSKIGTVDTVVDAIKTKTDNLPTNTATVLSTIQADLDNPSQYKSDATLAKQNTIISDIAGIPGGGVGVVGGAMLNAELFSQVPVFETWDGIIDINQILAAGIDDLALMTSRHPWATGWYLKEDAANSTISAIAAIKKYVILQTSAVIGEAVQLMCNRGYRIGFDGHTYFGVVDERLIFECVLKPELSNGTAMDWFVGFARQAGTTFLADPELVSSVAIRWGFAIDGDTNIYGIAADGSNTEVTSDYNLGSTNTVRYLKAIYDIGTNIKFYVDNTLIGTLSTRLPTDNDDNFFLYHYIQTTETTQKRLRNNAIRIRWQNGATP